MAIRWDIATTLSKRLELDTVYTGLIERVDFNDWHERMALIEAIDHWLARGMGYVDSTPRLR